MVEFAVPDHATWAGWRLAWGWAREMTRRHTTALRQKSWPLWPYVPPRYAAVALGVLLFAVGHFVFYDVLRSTTVKPDAVIPPAAYLLGMGCLVAAGLRVHLPRAVKRLYDKAYPVTLIIAIVLAVITVGLVLFSATAAAIVPGANLYSSDVMAFSHFDAATILAGHNPYTSDTAISDALRQFPLASITPLRQGIFGTGYVYPSTAAIASAEQSFLRDPRLVAAAIDPATLHSYPALAYLLYVPILWLGVSNILLVNYIVFFGLVAWLVVIASGIECRWVALLALAAVTIPLMSLLADTEIICFAFLLPAWHYRERRWLSALLLGLGCAFKQYCWYFAPFFLLDTLRVFGWREAARRAVLTFGVFLVPNLPFLLLNPLAWLHSLWLPITDPMFPMGEGIVALSLGSLLPFAAPSAYAIFELIALGACLWAGWRWHHLLGDGLPLLALIPLLFAFRSLPNYFAFAPWLALYAASQLYKSPNTVTPSSKPPVIVERVPSAVDTAEAVFP